MGVCRYCDTHVCLLDSCSAEADIWVFGRYALRRGSTTRPWVLQIYNGVMAIGCWLLDVQAAYESDWKLSYPMPDRSHAKEPICLGLGLGVRPSVPVPPALATGCGPQGQTPVCAQGLRGHLFVHKDYEGHWPVPLCYSATGDTFLVPKIQNDLSANKSG